MTIGLMLIIGCLVMFLDRGSWWDRSYTAIRENLAKNPEVYTQLLYSLTSFTSRAHNAITR